MKSLQLSVLRPTFTKSILLLLALMAIAGCGQAGPQSSTDVFFPTHSETAVPADRLEGSLLVESGCVVAVAAGERKLVLWPEGYSFSEDEVFDESGRVVARVGESVLFGAGEVPDQVASDLVGEIPEECSTGSYWMVGSVIRG